MAATLVSFVAVALVSVLALSFAFSVAAVSVAPVLSVLISEFVSFAFAFSDSVFFSLACEWEINSFERKRFIDIVYISCMMSFVVVQNLVFGQRFSDVYILVDCYFELKYEIGPSILKKKTSMYSMHLIHFEALNQFGFIFHFIKEMFIYFIFLLLLMEWHQ